MTTPPVLLSASFQHELESREGWDEETVLYQPYEVEQITMPDQAHCLAVRVFLKMLRLPFSIEHRMNAEHMSPTGKVPFVKCGHFVVAELEPIIEFARNKEFSLSNDMNDAEKRDMLAYMSLANSVLGNAQSYLVWIDQDTRPITWKRYGSVYPFPLNHWVTYLKMKSVNSRLQAVGWLNMKLDQVYQEVDRCCKALSDRLGESQYFFDGNGPTELDALVFGHIYTILTTALPTNKLAAQVRNYPNLLRHCEHIEERYFVYRST